MFINNPGSLKPEACPGNCLNTKKMLTNKEAPAPKLIRYLQARLKFAVAHTDKPNAFWRKVIWSDEKKIEMLPSIRLMFEGVNKNGQARWQ